MWDAPRSLNATYLCGTMISALNDVEIITFQFRHNVYTRRMGNMVIRLEKYNNQFSFDSSIEQKLRAWPELRSMWDECGCRLEVGICTLALVYQVCQIHISITEKENKNLPTWSCLSPWADVSSARVHSCPGVPPNCTKYFASRCIGCGPKETGSTTVWGTGFPTSGETEFPASREVANAKKSSACKNMIDNVIMLRGWEW